MRSLLALLVFVSATIAAADITKRLDPNDAVRLRPGEVCRYFRVSGGHSGKRLYQSLVVVRADYTVICKATDFESSFKMNKEQRESWDNSLKLYDHKRAVTGRRKAKTLPSAEEGGIDYYLSVRKGKTLYRANNVQFEMGYVFIIDNLEVYFYLERPKPKDPPGEH